MTKVIIQNINTSEVQAVNDPEGYDESLWNVLGIDREPLENEVWDLATGTWVVDQTLADAKAEEAEVINRKRLVTALKTARQRVLALEALTEQHTQDLSNAQQAFVALRDRVDALETEVAALKQAAGI